MDEKLLLELENAGWGKNPDGSIDDAETYCPVSLGCCVPDLGELIEACQPRFQSLTDAMGAGWVAKDMHIGLSKVEGIGKTPEEAVARLWLSLRKNEQG